MSRVYNNISVAELAEYISGTISKQVFVAGVPLFNTSTVTVSVWDGSSDTSWTGGDIKTAAQLKRFSELVNAGEDFFGETVNLRTNIFLNSIDKILRFADWGNPSSGILQGAQQWTPIGSQSINRPFRGTFKGNGFIVSGMYILVTTTPSNADRDKGLGLFGYIGSNASINSLRVTNSLINAPNNYLGLLVGRSDADVNSFRVLDCLVHGKIIGNNNSPDYTRYVGLVCGGALTTIFSRCSARGQITLNTVNNPLVGGIVGESYGGGCIECYANVDIDIQGASGTGGVGGLMGNLATTDGSRILLKNYACGKITIGNSFTNQGGFLGNATSSSFSSENNYWDTDIMSNGGVPISGLLGLTTDQMKDPSNFLDWDFAYTWNIGNPLVNAGRPYFKYEGNPRLFSRKTDVYNFDDKVFQNSWSLSNDPPPQGGVSGWTYNIEGESTVNKITSISDDITSSPPRLASARGDETMYVNGVDWTTTLTPNTTPGIVQSRIYNLGTFWQSRGSESDETSELRSLKFLVSAPCTVTVTARSSRWGSDRRLNLCVNGTLHGYMDLPGATAPDWTIHAFTDVPGPSEILVTGNGQSSNSIDVFNITVTYEGEPTGILTETEDLLATENNNALIIERI